MDMIIVISGLLVIVGVAWFFRELHNAPVLNDKEDAKGLEARVKEEELHQMIRCLNDDDILEVYEYVRKKLV